MTKKNYYFCPFCNLYPVEYVYDLNIFLFLHVCSTYVIRENIYYKNMFRDLRQTSNSEHDKRSLDRKSEECKFSTDNIPGVRKYKIVNDKPGIDKNIIFSSFCRDQTEQNYEFAFVTGPEITYFPPPMIKFQNPEKKKYPKFIFFCGRKILMIF